MGCNLTNNRGAFGSTHHGVCFFGWAPWCKTMIPSGELSHSNGKSPFLMGKSTISMAIFNCKLLVHQRVPLDLGYGANFQTKCKSTGSFLCFIMQKKLWTYFGWPLKLLPETSNQEFLQLHPIKPTRNGYLTVRHGIDGPFIHLYPFIDALHGISIYIHIYPLIAWRIFYPHVPQRLPGMARGRPAPPLSRICARRT